MSDLFHDLFIFEMANNHQGSVEHGLRIISEVGKIARLHGIKAAVKLQYRDLDTFVHPKYKECSDIKHIPRFMATRLNKTEFLTLIEAIRAEDLITIVTPFDEVSVETCLDHGVQILKVASCSAQDWPLLEKIAEARRPVIASTAGLTLHSIDKIVSFFQHKKNDFALMHCVAIYPTANDKVQMNFMERMKRRYPYIPIGYSGHEAPDNLDVVTVAVAKGACILERHVGIPTETIALNKYSMDPHQADKWVSTALRAKLICGQDGHQRKITQTEIDSLQSLKRGTYAKRAIKEGEQITANDVFFAMPCEEDQTDSGQFGQYRTTWTASRNYTAGDPIQERRTPDPISAVRSIVHDAKGMLFEAHIELGNNFDIELSHHYGLEHFRQTGALIFTVVNREYGKKIVVMLPGQSHPSHRHQLKEETFQLLWGDLELVLDGKIIHLKPGDKVLVERNVWHSFRTQDGAIFEEISTTHHRNDSEYQDKDIAAKDPMLRKTILNSW